jgi:16S rRNA (cytosine1402-N4)-methyltransferase
MEDLSGELYHVPVMLHEVLDNLQVKPDGVYVDCTMGGGGHSRGILSALGPQGKLIAFDQDADAVANLPDDERVLFVGENFRHLKRFLRLHQITQVDGLLADLGVSSHQFDEAGRGFSIRFDAPLDMRMDSRSALKAAGILADYTEEELHRIFEQYGEVTNAKTLARTIIEARRLGSMDTIFRFKQMIAGVVKGNPNRYFAQVFQALRMEVNNELGALKDLLSQLKEVIKPGGRAAFLTFHSLEDRMVKQYFKIGQTEEVEEDVLYGGREESGWELAAKKPWEAGEEERKKNPRSRSAKLRVAIRK